MSLLMKGEFLKKGMVQNAFSLGVLQGMNYLLPLITIPYLFRVLGPERYGLVAFGYAFTQYFMIITDFGFNLSSVKFISENREDTALVNHHVNSVIIARLFFSLISLLVLFILSSTVSRFSEERVFFLGFMGMVIGNALFPIWYFQGVEKMKFITIINVIAKGLSVLPFFIFVREPSDYIQVPFYYSLGYVIAGVYSMYLIYYKMGLKIYLVGWLDVWKVIGSSSGYFLSRASLSLFTTSNAFVLGLVCGNAQVGYYTIAEKIYQAYNALISPVNGVLFPHMAKSKDVPFFKRVFKWVSLGNVVVVVVTILFSSFILKILFDTDHASSINSLRILLVACVITIPSVLLGYPFLAAMGHPKFTNLTVMISALFHVSGLAILWVFGVISVESVSIMVLLTELLLFINRIYGVKKFKLFKTVDKE